MSKSGITTDDTVPKKMHFIWIGGPIPQIFADNIKKWKEKNPDYEVHLWIDTAASNPNQIDAVEKAANDAVADIGGEIHNLSEPKHPYFDAQSKNMNYYNDEITGESRNLAAASDILRMEILFREGGVYIDTDLPPNKPLGDIHAPLGFVKSTNFSNDFLCAIPGADLTDKFRNKITQNYSSVTQIDVDAHRNKRPWQNRTDTTLLWTGPDMIKTVINEQLIMMGNDKERLEFVEQFQLEDLETKFIEESSQTWRDKGPKDLTEANIYFKEELNFRLRHHIAESLSGMADEHKGKTRVALKNLEQRIRSTPETVPIHSIIHSWKAEHRKIKNKSVDSMSTSAERIHNLLEKGDYSQSQINALQSALFPKQKWDLEGASINGLEEGVSIQEAARQVYAQSTPTAKPVISHAFDRTAKLAEEADKSKRLTSSPAPGVASADVKTKLR